MEYLRKKRNIIIIIGAAVLSVVRMLVLLLGVDPSSGYHTSQFWAALQIVIVAAILFVAVVPSLRDKGQVPFRDCREFCTVAGLVAVAFSLHTVMMFVELWQNLSQTIFFYRVQVPWLSVIKIVLSGVSVVFFFLLWRNGTRFFKISHVALILGPIGLYVIGLVEDFMTITMNPSVDSYAVHLLSTGITLLFLSCFGRVLIEGTIKGHWFVMCAAASLLLALSAVAALVFGLLPAPVYRSMISTSTYVCDLAMMGLSLCCAFMVESTETAARRPRPRAKTALSLNYSNYVPKH